MTIDYKQILTDNGWSFSRICSSCGGSKHEWRHPDKKGWILYVWPGLRMFRVVDSTTSQKMAEGGFANMNEKLSAL